MPQAKPIFKPDDPSFKSSVKRVKASEGHCLPIFYKGSIIRIDDSSTFEIETESLGLEAKNQFFKALSDKQIIEIGAK